MNISDRSWHAKFYRFLELDAEPSVCKYWLCVLLAMPIFWVIVGPIWLIGAVVIKVVEGIGWLLDSPAEFLVRQIRRIKLCPFGTINFTTQPDEKGSLKKEGQ